MVYRNTSEAGLFDQEFTIESLSAMEILCKKSSDCAK